MAEIIRLPAANGQGLQLVKYDDDVILPNLVDPITALTLVRELPYKDGDILICSYPKCGLHWLSSMLWKLKNTDFAARKNPDILIEIAPEAHTEELESPRLLFTHMKPNRLPVNHIRNGGKILLLLRNPKDVVVSYYYHFRDSKMLANQQTFDEFFQSFMSGFVPWGSFWDYLDTWNVILQDVSAGRLNVQIEVFFYESLKKDNLATLERLNQFLNFNRDRRYLERIVEETTIATVREELAHLPLHPALLDEHGRSVICRKGIIGDWKNHLTVSQSEQIDRVMNGRGLENMFRFTYEN